MAVFLRPMTVSAQQTHLDRRADGVADCQKAYIGGCQRCGSNSPIMLERCVGSLVSTSFR